MVGTGDEHLADMVARIRREFDRYLESRVEPGFPPLWSRGELRGGSGSFGVLRGVSGC
jgi:hypothetical protein